jgi:hypothetical protein
MIDRLNELAGQTGPLASKAAKAVERGLKSHDPEIRAAAQRVKDMAVKPASQLPAAMYGYGQTATADYARGIIANITRVQAALRRLAQMQRDILETGSPAKEGPLSVNGGPEGWAQHTIKTYARGMLAGLPDVARASELIARAIMPGQIAAALGPSLTLAGGGGAAGSSATSSRSWTGDVNINVGGVTLQSGDAADVRELGRRLGEEIRLSLVRGPGLFAMDGSP